MSWSISTSIKPEGKTSEVSRQLQLATSDRTNIGNQQCEKERDDQIDSALVAAIDLIINSEMVHSAEDISVSMSGHANKDHNKDDAWSNEFISINIYTRNYK